MKINGKIYSAPNEDVVVIPRKDENIVFKLRAVLDYKEFEKLCPEPIAPRVRKAGSTASVEDTSDRGYIQQKMEHNLAWLSYLVIKTLEPSNIEWDTVKLDDWTTWKNWEKDFENAFFTRAEINYLHKRIMEVNSLSEEKLNEARQSFLLSQDSQP